MLTEHGMLARPYPDVRANTVSVVRSRRLRMDARLRGRRALPHRGPDASPPGGRGPPATPAKRSRSTPAGGASCRRSSPSGEIARRAGRQLARVRLQRQADRVDAVAQVRRRVVALALEHVTEVRVARARSAPRPAS